MPPFCHRGSIPRVSARVVTRATRFRVRKKLHCAGPTGWIGRVLDTRPAASAAICSPPVHAPGVLPSIIRAHRRMLVIVLPLATLSEVIELLMPIVLGLIIDHGVMAGDLGVTVLGAAGLIALRVLGVVLWAYTFVQSQKACMLDRHRLRVEVGRAS